MFKNYLLAIISCSANAHNRVLAEPLQKISNYLTSNKNVSNFFWYRTYAGGDSITVLIKLVNPDDSDLKKYIKFIADDYFVNNSSKSKKEKFPKVFWFKNIPNNNVLFDYNYIPILKGMNISSGGINVFNDNLRLRNEYSRLIIEIISKNKIDRIQLERYYLLILISYIHSLGIDIIGVSELLQHFYMTMTYINEKYDFNVLKSTKLSRENRIIKINEYISERHKLSNLESNEFLSSFWNILDSNYKFTDELIWLNDWIYNCKKFGKNIIKKFDSGKHVCPQDFVKFKDYNSRFYPLFPIYEFHLLCISSMLGMKKVDLVWCVFMSMKGFKNE